MSVELLYTSAEQGLKQGSRGFCTVISTAGMPLNLANRLESLSGYRHIYPPNSEESGRNPVAYSHLRLSVGGRVVSVISRVADYGLDYSQRTNKIAHHVVLDSSELSKAGPAWLMEQPGVFRSQWDGHCKTPGSGPVIPLGDRAPAVCRRWYSVVGDAGWAGVLADNLSSSNSKPIWIVFSIDQSAHLLPMLNEATLLLPVSERWQVTFSTYATTIPPDIDCRVRCVLEGSNEARLAPARGPVIDLTKPLPLAPSTPLVILAREGPKLESAVVRPAILPAALGGPRELGEHVDSGSKAMALPLASSKTTSVTNQGDVEDFEIDPDDEFEVLPLNPRSTKPPPPPLRPHGKSFSIEGKLDSRRKAILVLASAATLLVGVTLLAWVIFRNNNLAAVDKPTAQSEIEKQAVETNLNEPVSENTPETVRDGSQVTGTAEFGDAGASSNTANHTHDSEGDDQTGIKVGEETLDNAIVEVETPSPKNFPAPAAVESMPPDTGPGTGEATYSPKQFEHPLPPKDQGESEVRPEDSKSESKFVYTFEDKVFNAALVDFTNEMYYSGNFKFKSTLETKSSVLELYVKRSQHAYPNKIETIAGVGTEGTYKLVEESSPIQIFKGQCTLLNAKVNKDGTRIDLELEINIRDESLAAILEEVKKTKKDWNKLVSAPQPKTGPPNIMKTNENPFLTRQKFYMKKQSLIQQKAQINKRLDEIEKEIRARPLNEQSAAKESSMREVNELRNNLNFIEPPLMLLEGLDEQCNKLVNHQKQFVERLTGGGLLDFSNHIFVASDPQLPWEKWEPLVIKLQPALFGSASNHLQQSSLKHSSSSSLSTP